MIDAWKFQRFTLLPQLLKRRVRNEADFDRLCDARTTRVFTFDVFDTALVRTVAQPLDALALAAWRTEKRNGFGIGMRQLYEARRQAERQARHRARTQGRQEVTLEEIYENFPEALETAKSPMRSEELATERDICSANPVILAIYRKLLATGKRVAFLSDTCLPRDFVERLLADNGYDGPHEVFASSAFGTTKTHGDLFRRVAERLQVEPSSITHIGDNAGADFMQGRAAGVKALWYRSKLKRPAHENHAHYAQDEQGLAESLLAGIPYVLREEIANSPWEAIGLAIAGPLYLGFTQWLVEKLAESSPRRIYFFSRDGHIVKKIYDRFRNCSPEIPESRYLMVSRRALVIPGLEHIDEAVADQFTGRHNQMWLKAEEYLSRIGLNASTFYREMAEQGIPAGTLVDSEEKRDKLRRLLVTLGPEILRVARQERGPLMRYLKQEGCFDADECAISDIGWSGSMQRSLAALLKTVRSTIQVSGYYFGTHACMAQMPSASGTASGWLIDGDKPEGRRRILQSGLAVVELLFTANHGSVLNYAEENEEAAPALAAVGLTADYVEAAERVQDAALVFVDCYLKSFGGLTPPVLEREMVFPALARLIDCPTLAEAQAIGDLVQVDGLGTNAAEFGQPIAKPPSLWRAFAKPSAIFSSFLQAPWRLAFLVRLVRSPRLVFTAMLLRRRLELRSKPI